MMNLKPLFKSIIVPVVILTTFCSTPLVVAQKIIQLDSTVTISASRIESTILESGKSISVYTGEDLRQAPINTIDELLRFIPGVNVNARGAFGTQTDIGMRGSTFSQVLILLDGTKINDPLTGHYNQNIPVSIADIAQIEVIRGPVAASYGADAVGGVIHIKTKTFSAHNNTRIQNKFIGEAGLGRDGLFITDFGAYGQQKKIHYSFGIKNQNADGEVRDNPNANLLPTARETYRNYFDIQTYNASFAYLFNDKFKIYTRAGYDKRDFSAKYYYTSLKWDESTENTNGLWLQTKILSQIGSVNSSLNMAYKEANDTFIFNPDFSINQHETKMLNFIFNNNFTINENVKLAFGLQGGHREIDSNANGQHNNQAVAVFGTINYKPIEKVSFTFTGRYDTDDNYGAAFLPNLSVAYFPSKKLVLRGSIGSSIRGGDYVERFQNFQKSKKTVGGNLGNPFLSAERSISQELGFDYFPKGTFHITGALFRRSSKDLIDWVPVSGSSLDRIYFGVDRSSGVSYVQSNNVSESITSGFELSLYTTHHLSDKSFFKIGTGTTFLDTVQPNNDFSRYIANHPSWNHFLVLDFINPYANFHFTLSNTQRAGRANESISAKIKDNYTVAHLKVSKNIYEDKVGVFIKVINLFDTNYQEIFGAQMPSRWTMFGLRFDLQ